MWPYNNLWGLGNSGGWNPPVPVGGTPGAGQGGNVPWWVGVGVGLGERLGVWDWFGDWLGTGGSGNGGGGGYQGSWGGPGTGTTSGAGTTITADFITPLLNPGYQDVNSDQRRQILTYYAGLDGAIATFLEYLSSLGLAAQIVQRLSSGDIFAWPKIIQDLIILFYHDRPKADELAPTVVADGNKNAAPALGGGSMNQMMALAAKMKPPILPLVPREAYHVPPDYCLVRDPQTNAPTVMLKSVARGLGLFKPRAKAPISGVEYRNLRRSQAVEKKLARVLGKSANFTVRKKR